MFIYFAIFSLIALITGITLRIKLKNKVGSILIWVGVASGIISVVLFVCTLLLIYRRDANLGSKYKCETGQYFASYKFFISGILDF